MAKRAGYWFEAMRARGDSDEVVMTQFIGGRTLSRSYIHAETDGVGALYRFLAEQGLRDISLKGLGSSQKIGVAKRLRQFRESFKKVSGPRVKWPILDTPLESSQFFSLVFSEDELARLKKLCREEKTNLRVLLISYFHPYFVDWLEEKPELGTWMIPVTTRTPEELPLYENMASYFLLPVPDGADLKQISADFSREIKSGAYWGTYWALSLISLLGRGAVKRISDRAAGRGSFMGTFSDLGEWTFTHESPELREQLWASAPPASIQYPIGVSKLVLNEKMSVGIRINRRIRTPGRERIAADLEEIKVRMLSTGAR